MNQSHQYGAAVRYVTTKPHEHHPAGTECTAYRQDAELVLEFDDGVVVRLPGGSFYLEGIEPRPMKDAIFMLAM